MKIIKGMVVILLLFVCLLSGCTGNTKEEKYNLDINSKHVFNGAGICNDCGFQASVWDGQSSLEFSDGTGSASDPYIIKSASELAYFSKCSYNLDFENKHIRLESNIDLNGLEWTPIGHNKSFRGIFDGNGYTISSFIITQHYSGNGLFGYVSGTIKNLRVENFGIATSGNCFVGGIAGSTHGIISGCETMDGIIHISSGEKGTISIGGISGNNQGTIQNCHSNLSLVGIQLHSRGKVRCGGISGNNGRKIENCYFNGDISATSKKGFFEEKNGSYLGGIAGFHEGSIESCYVKSNIAVTKEDDQYYIGAIAGQIYDYSRGGEIAKCYVSEDTTLNVGHKEEPLDNKRYIISSNIGMFAIMEEKLDASIWKIGSTGATLRLFD